MANFTDDELDKHIKDAHSLYHERNRHEWKLDLSIIKDSGIKTLI